ncbi:SDR family NAD(P)-dependent oxidoreductase [Williamsia sp. CHRR-6]|uniref:SDR family NAD(P)-dependent oxidoreductase n=1 Tax=Williamsia sp. CHRR-6 TaxID=2835871 RepID=UPI001BDA78B2|nr:SDR family NAD(P)-dependent oxidoreductase [Williamsia sp. CHRR-6]MBT0566838.1 SDR family oxidoreductase [Williamsia sp. CHRR-6]
MSTENILDLTGHTALITGAGQGVGRAIALQFAANGASVVVNDFDAERAKNVVEELRAAGANATTAVGDVGDFEGFGAAIAAAADELGPIDILVNNAGNRGAEAPNSAPKPFWEQDPSDWNPYLNVNLHGVLNASRHVFPHMISKKYGRLITVVSDAGRVGEINGMESYSAAKAGAAGFTRSMARLGGRFGITANAVALGATRTPATEAAMGNEDFAKKVLSSYVVRRFGEPEDAANMVLFLASGASSWITGQTIPVNGGYSFTL